MSIGFKGFFYCSIWELNCLKIEACSKNARTISGVEVYIGSWISCPLQHAEPLKSKNTWKPLQNSTKMFLPKCCFPVIIPLCRVKLLMLSITFAKREDQLYHFDFSASKYLYRQVNVPLTSSRTIYFKLQQSRCRCHPLQGDMVGDHCAPQAEGHSLGQTQAAGSNKNLNQLLLLLWWRSVPAPTSLSLGNWLNQ